MVKTLRDYDGGELDAQSGIDRARVTLVDLPLPGLSR